MDLLLLPEEAFCNLLLVSELREAARLEEVYYSERQKIFDFVRPRIAEEYNLPKELTLAQMSSIYYEKSDYKKIKLLIEHGDFASCVSEFLSKKDIPKILTLACDFGRVETVRMLLKKQGHSTTDDNVNILFSSVNSRSEEMLKLIDLAVLPGIVFYLETIDSVSWVFDTLKIKTNEKYILGLFHCNLSLDSLDLILKRAEKDSLQKMFEYYINLWERYVPESMKKGMSEVFEKYL